MRKLMMLGCMGLMFAVSSAAFAGPQQERMRFCSKDAKEKALKGAERKAFMKTCLRKKAVAGEEMQAAQPPADAPKEKH